MHRPVASIDQEHIVMTTLQEKIANERRRLRSVRQKLTAAVKQKSQGDEAFLPFYIAATEYMEAAMGRLHAQDIKMGDMIREKVEKIDDGVSQALAELDERLSGNQDYLKKFLAAGAALRDDGMSAIATFEEVTEAYCDYIVATMGHHGATTDLSQRLFSADDWAYMAGITDEEMQREADLFQKVTNTVPENLEVAEA